MSGSREAQVGRPNVKVIVMIAFFSVLLLSGKLGFIEAKLRFRLYRRLWCWLRPQGLPNVAADDAPWTVLGLSWGSRGRLGAILERPGAQDGQYKASSAATFG